MMGRISAGMRKDLRVQASKFLAEHGFTKPPLPPDEALEARKLTVTQYSLDDLLLKANLPPDDHKKIQAMINTPARAVTFRSGLAVQQRNWGSLHEIAHEFLPWQRETIYYCPLLMLPAHLQKQFEAEADIFAAEAFFFGEVFIKQAAKLDWGLGSVIELADDVYGTSFHATFRHYVENSETPCCLLVWRPANNDGNLWMPTTSMTLHYYIPSSRFRGHIDPGQIADSDDVITKVFAEPNRKPVKHEMQFKTKVGQELISEAESFSNSYTVFTLIKQPQPKKLLVPVGTRST